MHLNNQVGLTKQESKVLHLMSRSLTNNEIARALFVTENTVKVHIRNIMQKLNAHHRLEVVTYAIEEDLEHSVDGGTPEPV